MTTSYVLTTWLPINPTEKKTYHLDAISDEKAVEAAQSSVTEENGVGTLSRPDGTVITRLYYIVYVSNMGADVHVSDELPREVFFAKDDDEAECVLEGTYVDWSNMLFGPEGVITSKR